MALDDVIVRVMNENALSISILFARDECNSWFGADNFECCCLPGLQSNSATISLVQSRAFPAFAHTFVEAVTDKTLVIVFY